MNNTSLSVCILTKNNEATIGYSLKSVQPYASQIVIVDSGSTDKTLDIAKHYTSNIYFRALTDFSAQRNFALSLCSCDYVLFLDSDEVIGENFGEIFYYLRCGYQTLSLPRYNLISLNPLLYLITYHHYRNWQTRVIRNNRRSYYANAVHETVKNHQPRLHCADCHIFHFDYLIKDYAERKKKLDFYKNLDESGAYAQFYLFDDYPYRSAKAFEQPAPSLLEEMQADPFLNKLAYEKHYSFWTDARQFIHHRAYKILTKAKASLRKMVYRL